MSKIVVKFPTRSRPEKFKQVLQKYIDFLSGKHELRFVITMDEDDTTMNTPEIKEWLDSLDIDLKYNYGHSKTKIEACNADLEGEDGDILVLVSDDMVPCLEGWDDIIAEGFNQIFPDYCGAIKFNDGLRGPDDLLMTLPVLGFPVYRAMGHLYHPDYTSLYCDTEMTALFAKMNILAKSPTCIIRHAWVPGDHPDADALHQRNENAEMYAKDGAIYQERMKNDFDMNSVKERLDAERPVADKT